MSRQLVIFSIGPRRFGLDLHAVERVTRAVFVTEVPDSPTGVMGVINVQGQILPVVDLRRLWGETREDEGIALTDDFIIVRRTARTEDSPAPPTHGQVALWVESVEGVVNYAPEDWVTLDTVLEGDPGAPRYFEGAVKMCGQIVLVCGPDALLGSVEDPPLSFSLAEAADS